MNKSNSLKKASFKNIGFSLSNSIAFFDFDNTITTFDVLDDLIKRFSINDKWKKLENDWVDGKIGSKKCLEGQLAGVRITKKALDEYLTKVTIDKYFNKLLALLRQKGSIPMIVSDDFYFIIKTILKNNGTGKIKIFSNTLRFSKNRLIPSFPHVNKLCLKSANCKRNHIFNNGRGKKKIIYIGDGLSDVCASGYADLVFAKGRLLDYLKNKKKPYVGFDNLGNVYAFLKEAI